MACWIRFLVVTLVLGTLTACVSHPQRPIEDPHHYSRDAAGNRLACYSTETPREYECHPVDTDLAHHHHNYEPLWPLFGLGLIYSWHHPHMGHHWHHRRHQHWRHRR